MEKIWLQHYPDGISADINPSLFKSLPDMFAASVKKYADRPAVKCLGAKLNYRELDEKSTQFATFLQKRLNHKKGDRIALMLPNVSQYLIAMYGALKAGCVVVNVNPMYTERELTHQMNDADVNTILVLANFAHTVEASIPKTHLKNIIITEVADTHPFPKSILMNFAIKHVKKAVKPYKISGVISFNKALKFGAKHQFTPVDTVETDLAFLQYTGGTTGIAKGAMLTHKNLMANVEQALGWLKKQFVYGEECAAVLLPLYHIFSLVANAFVFMRAGSECVLVPNPRDLPGVVKTFRENSFTAFMGVNTLFNALLSRKGFRELNLSGLKVVIGGGMAVQKAVAEKWQKSTGTTILEGFGLTEASPIVCINPITNTSYNGSIGLPIPSTEIKVIDEDSNELAIDEVGELCFKGPQVMKGYWRRSDETKNVLSDDGWLKTGDIGRVDKNGFVYIIDRKKDMISVAGFNVYPNEVEEVIAHCPGVKEVAVIGVPNTVVGEIVKAFVVKEDDALTKGHLMVFCKENLVNYKVPKRFEFCDELPKTTVGKILRRALREKENIKC